MVPSAAMEFNGLEFLERWRQGEFGFPPLVEYLDIEGVEFGRGRAVFASTPSEQHYSVLGRVHGGVISTLLDTALGCAVHTTLEAGEAYATTELSVNFIRPVDAETGRVIITGEVIHVGRNVATAQAYMISEESDKLLAHAKATLHIARRQ